MEAGNNTRGCANTRRPVVCSRGRDPDGRPPPLPWKGSRWSGSARAGPASAKCTLAGRRRRRPAPGHYLHLPRRAIDGRPRTPLRGPLRAATGLPAHGSLVLGGGVRPHAIDRAVASPAAACLATASDALGRLSAVAFSRPPGGPAFFRGQGSVPSTRTALTEMGRRHVRPAVVVVSRLLSVQFCGPSSLGPNTVGRRNRALWQRARAALPACHVFCHIYLR